VNSTIRVGLTRKPKKQQPRLRRALPHPRDRVPKLPLRAPRHRPIRRDARPRLLSPLPQARLQGREGTMRGGLVITWLGVVILIRNHANELD
jgi:hypothetical protein